MPVNDQQYEHSFDSTAISAKSFWAAPNLTSMHSQVYGGLQCSDSSCTCHILTLNLAPNVCIRTFVSCNYTFRKDVKYCGKCVGPVLYATARRKTSHIPVKLLKKEWDKKE